MSKQVCFNVSCKECRYNDDDGRLSTCRVSGVTTRRDYKPAVCYGYKPEPSMQEVAR